MEGREGEGSLEEGLKGGLVRREEMEEWEMGGKEIYWGSKVVRLFVQVLEGPVQEAKKARQGEKVVMAEVEAVGRGGNHRFARRRGKEDGRSSEQLCLRTMYR